MREGAIAAPYKVLRNPLLTIVGRLRSLADYLVCPDIDERTNAKGLAAFGKSLSSSISCMVHPDRGSTN